MRRLLVFCCIACLLWAVSVAAEDFIITQEELPDTVSQEQNAVVAQGTPVPLPDGFDTLRPGQSGEWVRIAQQRLLDLGYFSGTPDGYYLESTQAAVNAFQSYNGLATTSKVNATTWYAMMSEQAVPKEQSTLSPVQTPGPEQTATVTAQVLNLDGQAPVLSRTLRYDDQGEEVRQLQLRLTELGYYTMEATGNFYDNTNKAVRAFQRKHRLSDDGVVGEKTWTALFSSDAISADGAEKPLQYMLMVDVTNQITYAYELDETTGEHTRLVRQMICSTGTSGWETPLKTTQSAGDRARWGYFPKWGSYAQYLTRIDKLNAFHSVLYSTTNVYKLNVGSYQNLGKRASHGCVRLLVEDAKWIYDNCPNGTTITVYEGVSDPELTEMLKPPPLNYDTMLPSETQRPVYPEVWDPAAVPAARQMQEGSTGEDVWWLQNLLYTLGYYRGTISGGYYGGTGAAIRAFQQDQGLPGDGICGVQTWGVLLQAMHSAGTGARVVAQPGQALPTASPNPYLITMPPMEVQVTPQPSFTSGDGVVLPDAGETTTVPPQTQGTAAPSVWAPGGG